MTMMRGFFTVGFWTLVSRVMGFLRDVLIAVRSWGLPGGRGVFPGIFFAKSVS